MNLTAADFHERAVAWLESLPEPTHEKVDELDHDEVERQAIAEAVRSGRLDKILPIPERP